MEKYVWQLFVGRSRPSWDDVYSGKGERWTGGQAPQMLGNNLRDSLAQQAGRKEPPRVSCRPQQAAPCQKNKKRLGS